MTPEELLATLSEAFEAAHYQWHQMAASYNSPTEFHYAFRAFIQEARNITFRVQSLKDEIPRFLVWYSDWQRVYSSSPLMRWANDTRVEVTKRRGFKAQSVAIASVTHSYCDDVVVQMSADPYDSDDAILARVVELVPRVARPYSTVTLRRRWVSDDLPDDDVLSAAMAILQHHRALLDSLADLILSGSYGVPFVYLNRLDMSGCLADMDDPTVGRYRCDGSATVHVVRTVPAASDKSQRKHAAHLARRNKGRPMPNIGAISPDETMEQIVHTQMEMAEYLLTGDGFFASVLWTHSPSGWALGFPVFEDKAAKYSFFHDLADQVRRTDIDSVVFGGEQWVVYDPALFHAPYPDLADHPLREEQISVTGIDHSGSALTLARRFKRKRRGRPVLDGQRVQHSKLEAMTFFLPVLRVWGAVLEGGPVGGEAADPLPTQHSGAEATTQPHGPD